MCKKIMLFIIILYSAYIPSVYANALLDKIAKELCATKSRTGSMNLTSNEKEQLEQLIGKNYSFTGEVNIDVFIFTYHIHRFKIREKTMSCEFLKSYGDKSPLYDKVILDGTTLKKSPS